MSTNAQVEKDKGNTAFRAEKYPEAVGHYSAAIFADSTDPTLPLNRAAAYLKLGKNIDAERDCSTVLSLKPGHVKALYRRAQARIELQKKVEARQDLLEALKHEPNNATVKAELQKLEATGSSSSPRDVGKDPIEVVQPRRRRVPIDIVDTPPKASDQLIPVSSRSLSTKADKPPERPVASSSSSTSPLDVPEKAKGELSENTSSQQSESSQPIRVPPPIPRGGIFRQSGEHTLFRQASLSDTQVNDSAKSATGRHAVTAPTPVSLFEFLRAWEFASPAERWDLLSQIPPEALPSLFKTSLEASVLVQIIDVLIQVASEAEDDSKQRIREYLRWFPRVPRIGTVTLFLSKDEKEQINSLISSVGAAPWPI